VGVTRASCTVPLRGGDVVVLYSDGLVERRSENIDEGLARLEAAALGAYGLPVHQMADLLMRQVLVDDPEDDVVLVVKRLEV
jgi:serine phosphatase RsbU (regulator of sigma subunit)